MIRTDRKLELTTIISRGKTATLNFKKKVSDYIGHLVVSAVQSTPLFSRIASLFEKNVREKSPNKEPSIPTPIHAGPRLSTVSQQYVFNFGPLGPIENIRAESPVGREINFAAPIVRRSQRRERRIPGIFHIKETRGRDILFTNGRRWRLYGRDNPFSGKKGISKCSVYIVRDEQSERGLFRLESGLSVKPQYATPYGACAPEVPGSCRTLLDRRTR